jgi:hypothetical protein
MSEEFDWSPLNEAFWVEAGKTTGATPLQVRFACCRHRGMTAAGAARAAGYSGDDDSIRQAGSRAAKSTAVLNLLALATAESGGGDDGVVGTGEARRILSRLARGSDPNVRIKALDSLQKIEDRQRAERLQDDGPSDPVETTRQLFACTGIFGAVMVSEMWHNSTGDVTLAPHFELFGPFVARRCPELWSKYREPLAKRAECFRGDEREQRYLQAFDAIGAAPEPSDEQFRAAIGAVVTPRVNGSAAVPLPEQIEQAETAQNAAAD